MFQFVDRRYIKLKIIEFVLFITGGLLIGSAYGWKVGLGVVVISLAIKVGKQI